MCRIKKRCLFCGNIIYNRRRHAVYCYACSLQITEVNRKIAREKFLSKRKKLKPLITN